MRITQNPIQTHREAPANTRFPGQAWLVRAGYLDHIGQILNLGERALARLKALAPAPACFTSLSLPTLLGAPETYAPTPFGNLDLLTCPSCGFTSRHELAVAKKTPYSSEAPAPLVKTSTPNCPSIESLAAFLGIAPQQTAKALLFIRKTDEQFIFVVIRGDHTLSPAKLNALVGETRLASEAEIRAIGAIPGYASPIRVRNTLIIVDDLIPHSPNLVAGANESGYHLLNTNYGRDYTAEIIADLTLAAPGDPCPTCAAPRQAIKGWAIATDAELHPQNTLFTLAETFHDEKGLTLPAPVAPFDIHLLHVPGKSIDTLPAAEDIYRTLCEAGFSVLFDDRNERAGVKFNDADLIGCPIRITVGERGLQNGNVEVKKRTSSETEQVPLDSIQDKITSG